MHDERGIEMDDDGQIPNAISRLGDSCNLKLKLLKEF